MTGTLQLLVTLAGGVIVGVLGNFAYQWVREFGGRAFEAVDLAGVWGERMGDGGSRRYSVGRIRWDLRRMMWVFDGTNYNNDGTPFCHWRTVASYLDRRDRRFYYVFLNTHVDAIHTGYTGFGFVDLARAGRTWSPSRGAFAAGNPDEAFRSHSMVRLNVSPTTRTDVLAAFHAIER